MKGIVNQAGRQYLFGILVVLLSTVIFGGLLEVYFRWCSRAVIIDPQVVMEGRKRAAQRLEFEPSIFSLNIFPLREQKTVSGKGIEYFINGKGFRGHDFPAEKQPGVVRIFIYGGSHVFDPYAAEGRDWPHRIEAGLNAAGVRSEVVNAGMPAHTSLDCFGRYFAEGHYYHPDYVLLCSAWNDLKFFRSNAPPLRSIKRYSKFNDPRLYFHNVIDRALGHSKAYLALRDAYYLQALDIGPEGRKPSGEYSPGISPEALAQYRLNIELFVQAARKTGARPVLMTEARLVRPGNTDRQKKRIRYDYVLFNHQELCAALQKADEIIIAVAKKEGVPLIDANRELGGREELFVDHVHLADQGSQELARMATESLLQIIKSERRDFSIPR